MPNNPLTSRQVYPILAVMARMTNKEFAERVDVTDSYASYLRNGQRMPSGDLLVRIILTFELDPFSAMNAYQEGGDAFGAFLRDTVFGDASQPTENAGTPVQP